MRAVRCGFCGDCVDATHAWTRKGLHLCCDCLIDLEPLINGRTAVSQSEAPCSFCQESRSIVVSNKNGLLICVDCLQQSVADMRDRGLLDEPEGPCRLPGWPAYSPEDVRKAIDSGDIEPLWRQIISHRWALNGAAWSLNELHQKFFPHLPMREFRHELQRWESHIMRNLEK